MRAVVDRFCTSDPDVVVHVLDGTASSAGTAVLAGEADVGFDISESAVDWLNLLALDRLEVGVVCASGHPAGRV